MARCYLSVFGIYAAATCISIFVAVSRAQFPTDSWSRDLYPRDIHRQPPLPTFDQGPLTDSAAIPLNNQRNLLGISDNTFPGNNPSQPRRTSYNRRYNSRGKREADRIQKFQTELSSLLHINLRQTEYGKNRVKRQAPGFQTWDFHPSSLVRRNLILAREQTNRQKGVPNNVHRTSTNRQNSITNKGAASPSVKANNLPTKKQAVSIATNLNSQPADVNIELPVAHYNALLQQNKMFLEPQNMHVSPGVNIATKTQKTDNNKVTMHSTNTLDMPGNQPRSGPRYTNSGLQTQGNPQLQFDLTAAALLSGEAGPLQQPINGNKMLNVESRNKTGKPARNVNKTANQNMNFINSNDVLLDIKQLNDLIDRTARILLKNRGNIDTNPHNSILNSIALSVEEPQHSKGQITDLGNPLAAAKFQPEMFKVQKKSAQQQSVPPNQPQILNKEMPKPLQNPAQVSMPTHERMQKFQQQLLNAKPEQKRKSTSIQDSKPTFLQNKQQEILKAQIFPSPVPETSKQNQQQLFNPRNIPLQSPTFLQDNTKQMLNVRNNKAKASLLQDQNGQVLSQKNQGPFQQLLLNRHSKPQEQTQIPKSQQKHLGKMLNAESQQGQILLNSALQQSPQQHQQNMLYVLNQLEQILAPVNLQQLQQHMFDTQTQPGQVPVPLKQTQHQSQEQMLNSEKQPARNKPIIQQYQQQFQNQKSETQQPTQIRQNTNQNNKKLLSTKSTPRRSNVPFDNSQQQMLNTHINLVQEPTSLQQTPTHVRLGTQAQPGQEPVPSQQNLKVSHQLMSDIHLQQQHAPVSSQQDQLLQEQMLGPNVLPKQAQMTTKQDHQTSQQKMLGTQTVSRQAPMSSQQGQQISMQQSKGTQRLPSQASISWQQGQQISNQALLDTQTLPRQAQMSSQQGQQITQQRTLNTQTKPSQNPMSSQQGQQITQQRTLDTQALPRQFPMSSQQGQQITQQQALNTQTLPRQNPMSSQQGQEMTQQQTLNTQTLPSQNQMSPQQGQQITQQRTLNTQALPRQNPMSSQQGQQITQQQTLNTQTLPRQNQMSPQQGQEITQQRTLNTQALPRQNQMSPQQGQQITQQQTLNTQTLPSQNPMSSQQGQQIPQQQTLNTQALPRQNPVSPQQGQQITQQQTLNAQALSRQNRMSPQQGQQITQQRALNTQTLPRQNPMSPQQGQEITQQRTLNNQALPRQNPMSSQQGQQITQQQTLNTQTLPRQNPMSSQQGQEMTQQRTLNTQTLPRQNKMSPQQGQQIMQQQILDTQTLRGQAPMSSQQGQQRSQQHILDTQVLPRQAPMFLQKENQISQEQILNTQNQPRKAAVKTQKFEHIKQQMWNAPNQAQAPGLASIRQNKQLHQHVFDNLNQPIKGSVSQKQNQVHDMQHTFNVKIGSQHMAQTTSGIYPSKEPDRRIASSLSTQDRLQPIHPTANYQIKQDLTPRFPQQQFSQNVLSTPRREKLLLSFNTKDNRFHLHPRTPQTESHNTISGQINLTRPRKLKKSLKRNTKRQGIPLPFDRQIDFGHQMRQVKAIEEHPVRKETLKMTASKRQKQNRNPTTTPIRQTTVSSGNRRGTQIDNIQYDANAPADVVLDNPLKPISLWIPSPDVPVGHPVTTTWKRPIQKTKRRPKVSKNMSSGRRNGARSASSSSSTRARGSVKGGDYVRNWFNPRLFNNSSADRNQASAVARDRSASNNNHNESDKAIFNRNNSSANRDINISRPGKTINVKNNSSFQESANHKWERKGRRMMQNNQGRLRIPSEGSKQQTHQRGRSGRRPGNVGRSFKRTRPSKDNTLSSRNSKEHQKSLDRRQNKSTGRRPTMNDLNIKKTVERKSQTDSTAKVDLMPLQESNFQPNHGFRGSDGVKFDHRVHTTVSPPTIQTTIAGSTTGKWSAWNQPLSNSSASSASLDASFLPQTFNSSWNGNIQNVKQLNQSTGSDIKRNRTISITQKVRESQNATQARHALPPINFNVFLGIPKTTEKPQKGSSNTADVLRLLNALSVLRGSFGPPSTILPPVKIVVQMERDMKPAKLRCRCFPKSDGCPSELKEEPLMDMCDVRDSIPCCEDG